MLLAVKATHTMPTNRATYLRNSRPLTFRGARGAFEAGVSVARDFVDTLCNIGKHAVRANPSQTLHPRCVGIGRYGQPPRSGIACQQTYHNDSIFGETVVFPHMDRPNAEVTKADVTEPAAHNLDGAGGCGSNSVQLTRADESERRDSAHPTSSNMETDMASANVTLQSSDAVARAMQALIETSSESEAKFVVGWGQNRSQNSRGPEAHGCGCGCGRR